MRGRFDDMVIEGATHRSYLRWEKQGITLAGAITLNNTDHTLQVLDPGGASRNVTLPTASNAANRGQMFIIVNLADVATEMLVVKSAANTLVTVQPGAA